MQQVNIRAVLLKNEDELLPIAHAMMLDMPLCGLVTFGRMTQDQLNRMLKKINN